MKACGSITHLLVFLLHWITVSVANSSSEWNENKTIIQRMRVCRKGRKGCDSFQEFRLISVMGHVHLRQEKISRWCPREPHYPFAFGPTETPQLWQGPSGRPSLRGTGECWRHSDLCFLSPPTIARAWSPRAPCPVAVSCPSVQTNSQLSMEQWQPPGRMITEQHAAGEDICDACRRKDFKPSIWRHCVCVDPAAFSAVLLQGREGIQGTDHSLQHPCKHLTTSLMKISILRSLGSFLRCFLIRGPAFFLLSSGRTEAQPLLGTYLKQPPQRKGPFSNFHTDIRDGPTCQAPRLFSRMERKFSTTGELSSVKGAWRAWRLLYSLSWQAHRRGRLGFLMGIDPVYSWPKSHKQIFPPFASWRSNLLRLLL